MGDNQRIKVAGYGIAKIKIDGHIITLVNALHVPELESNLFSATYHSSNGFGCSFLLSQGLTHLSFPSFSISQSIPTDGDLCVKLQPLTTCDWHFSLFNCNSTEEPLMPDQVNFLNKIYFGRAITRAQEQAKLKELQSHLQSGNESCDNKETRTCRNSPANNRFIEEGNPDNVICDYLAGLTIHNICKYRNDTKLESTNSETMDCVAISPPPQYHLESSKGDVKEGITRYALQDYFGGRQLADFSVLSLLGTGLNVINNDNKVPSIDTLVNRKRGKQKRKGSKIVSPSEVVGMDIGYGVDDSIGGYKYVLILVNQCTRQSFLYCMKGSSGADITEALWKFFIDTGGFPKMIQCDFDPRFIDGKAPALL